MKKIHKKYLTTCHPKLFKVPIYCGDGWYNILSTLADKLQTIKKASKIQVEATDIKQKMGSLRFYYREIYNILKVRNYHSWSNIISDVIYMAENMSRITCEQCGAYGTINNVGGSKTCLCGTCRAKKEEK